MNHIDTVIDVSNIGQSALLMECNKTNQKVVTHDGITISITVPSCPPLSMTWGAHGPCLPESIHHPAES